MVIRTGACPPPAELNVLFNNRAKQKGNIAGLKAPRGRFSVIVVDPPWPYEKRTGDVTKRGAIPYPAMTVADIQRLRIPGAPDCYGRY